MAKVTIVLEDMPEQGTVMVWANVENASNEITQATLLFQDTMEFIDSLVEGFNLCNLKPH